MCHIYYHIYNLVYVGCVLYQITITGVQEIEVVEVNVSINATGMTIPSRTHKHSDEYKYVCTHIYDIIVSTGCVCVVLSSCRYIVHHVVK